MHFPTALVVVFSAVALGAPKHLDQVNQQDGMKMTPMRASNWNTSTMKDAMSPPKQHHALDHIMAVLFDRQNKPVGGNDGADEDKKMVKNNNNNNNNRMKPVGRNYGADDDMSMKMNKMNRPYGTDDDMSMKMNKMMHVGGNDDFNDDKKMVKNNNNKMNRPYGADDDMSMKMNKMMHVGGNDDMKMVKNNDKMAKHNNKMNRPAGGNNGAEDDMAMKMKMMKGTQKNSIKIGMTPNCTGIEYECTHCDGDFTCETRPDCEYCYESGAFEGDGDRH